MRMGKKKLLQFTAIVMCLICLTGCGAGPALPEDTDIPVNVQDILTAGSEGQQQPDGSGTTGDSAELPEGYVYDYQASLEPIPQEIADLGGMCVGTMHAFPSRIMVGLMKQRMEEDPELKAEVEKRVEEVKQSLSEEIGGEFEVEIMSVEDKWDWVFYCTEKKTGYEFSMSYYNFEYNDPTGGVKNHLFILDYYDKIEAQEYEADIEPIVFQLYNNRCYSIWSQSKADEIDIYVAQFTDEKMNYEEEQIRILKFWEALQNYNAEMDYFICVGFYPANYERLMIEKFKEGTYEDIFLYEEKMQILINSKDIQDVFYYSEFVHKNNTINLDTLLNDYTNGTYNETEKWQYWIGER